MKVGDKVRLSSIGKKEYEDALNNPYNLIGEIVEIINHVFGYKVKWSNLANNSYEANELELVNESTISTIYDYRDTKIVGFKTYDDILDTVKVLSKYVDSWFHGEPILDKTHLDYLKDENVNLLYISKDNILYYGKNQILDGLKNKIDFRDVVGISGTQEIKFNVGDFVHKFSGSDIYIIKSIEGTTATIIHNRSLSSYKDNIKNLVLFNPDIVSGTNIGSMIIGEKYGHKYEVTKDGEKYMWSEAQIREHIYFKNELEEKDSFKTFDDDTLSSDYSGLPKYFIIERDSSNPLWEEYIKWFSNKSGTKFRGDSTYYGYDGSRYWNGYDYQRNADNFINNPTLITLEQWSSVINRHEHLLSIDVGETGGCPTSTVTVDNHGNILNTNIGLMNTMNKLNTIRADKFFAQEKNLAAIEKIDETIKDACDLIATTKDELSSMQSKLISLNRKLEIATNEQDVATLKDLIAGAKAIEDFVSELKGKTIAKFETAKTKFNVADFLKD